MNKLKLLDGLFRFTKLAATRVPLAKPKNPDTVILNVPGYLQLNSYCCAVTAGYMVLRFFGIQEEFGKFYRRINPDPENGTSWSVLGHALMKAGAYCYLERHLDFDGICQHLNLGNPLIVSIRNPGQSHNHFVVIYGYGLNPQRLFVAVNDLPFCQEYRYTEFLVLLKQSRALVCTGRRASVAKRKLVPAKIGIK